jgi:VWFA-related protein
LRLSRITLFSSILLCLAAISLHAQNTAADAQNTVPLIKTNAQAVAVDVVVTKGSGEAVVGLAQRDFEVFEDGKPQTIDLFEEHTAAVEAPAPVPQQLPPNVFSNAPVAPESDSVNVLLLDSLNTAVADQAFVRKQIAGFLATMEPGARVAIFTLNTRLRLLQGFTADAALLKAALGSKNAAPGVNPASRGRNDELREKEELSIVQEQVGTSDNGNQGAFQAMSRSLAGHAELQAGQRSSLTLAALQQLARALAAIPGRKNLIWFASSFPVSIFPNGQDRQTLPNGKELGDAVRQTANLLTQAKVAVYPVSAQGIQADRTMDADSGGQPTGDNFQRAPQGEAATQASNIAAMEQLAADTGGKASYTSNNVSQAISHALADGSHYYTLVYTPQNRQLDGKFRRIEIKLAQGKASLAYRRGYFADTPQQAQPASDPLAPLLAHGNPASTQLVYQARVVPAPQQPAADTPRAGGNAKLNGPLTRFKVDLSIPAAGLALEPQPDGTRSGKIEVALVAYGKDGSAVNWTGQTLGLNLNAVSYAQVLKSGIPIHLQLDLPPAGVSLVSGVYDLTARKAGTMEIPIQPAPATAATP